MDPITVIVSAVAAGASAGAKDVAASGIKDAYIALKRLITERYDAVDVTPVEERPDSEAKRRSLEEDLADAGAEADEQILMAAQHVIQEVLKHDPATSTAIGIDLDDVRARGLRIRNVDSSGTAVQGSGLRIRRDIDIEDIRAGRPPERP